MTQLATVQNLPEAFRTPTKENIDALEARLLASGFDSMDLPVEHRFAPDIYIRELFMPAGLIVIGHAHLTSHFNIVLSGEAAVIMNGELRVIRGPSTIVSDAGIRKVLHIREDMIWQTVHSNPENITNVPTLEDMFVTKSEAFLRHLALKDRARSIEAAEELLAQFAI